MSAASGNVVGPPYQELTVELAAFSHQQRNRIRFLTLAVMVSLGALGGAYHSYLILLDGLIYDLSLAAIAKPPALSPESSPAPESSPVAVVSIGQRSLDAPELASTPRSLFQPVVGRLIHVLSQAGMAAIGFDVLFTFSGNRFVSGYDTPMLRALYRNRAKVVLGRSAIRGPVRSIFAALRFDPKSLGLLELGPDADGVYRHIRAMAGEGEHKVPSLTAATLRKAGFDKLPQRVLIAPRRHPGSLPIYALIDILRCAQSEPERLVEAFKGRVVFVGTTLREEDQKSAPSRFMAPPPVPPSLEAWRDPVHDPLAEPDPTCRLQSIGPIVNSKELIPGVLLHAMGARAIIENKIMRPMPDLALVLWSAALAGVGGLIGLSLAPLLALLALLLITAGTWAASIGLLLILVWMPPMALILSASLAMVGTFPIRYLLETRQHHQIKKAFRQYLSPDLVERIAADPSSLHLGGETRPITLLFSDIRGFTAISESLKDRPQDLVSLVNRLLTTLSRPILHHGGTIDKYMGDCVMAFWNAPLDDPQHARHACLSALEMIRAVETLNRRLAKESRSGGEAPPSLAVGIGINSGSVVVGNMGSEQRFDYTALGDAVNLAARLEGQCRTYGVPIILGDNSCRAVPDLATLEIDRIAVKGKTEPVTIHALLGGEEKARSAPFRRLASAHGRFLEAYRRRDWDAALSHSTTCAVETPELSALYDLYRQRMESYRIQPLPDGWDGVFRATQK